MPASSPPPTAEPDLDAQVQERLDRARIAYAEHDYVGAEQLDQEALALARRRGCRAGQVRALRFLGLCAYRLGRADQSARLLDESLAAAQELHWVSEELLVCNHLGASLRKTGDLERAHLVLGSGLERARDLRFVVARVRLLGSMGALYDDLGDLDAAADCYARYQELLWLTQDVSRQANAAGLNSRVQRLRGRHEAALMSARLERRLGTQAKDAVRASRGALHEAQALTALGRHDQAKSVLAEAERLLAGGGDARHQVRLAGARARASLDARDFQEADAHARRGWRVLRDAGLDRELEMIAGLAETSAQVSSAVGLHGEALWHLGEALGAHLKRFESISSRSLRRLTAGRRSRLCALADRVVAEEGSVGRAADEVERVQGLVKRLMQFDEDPPLRSRERPDVLRWRSELDTSSKERWRALLGPGIDRLGEGTREDLVLADVLSHGPVGDLPRGLFLLMTAVERELYQRVFAPLGRQLAREQLRERVRRLFRGEGPPPTVGQMQHFLVGKPIPAVAEHLHSGAMDRLRALARQLAAKPTALDGSLGRSPMEVRNAVAHGRDYGLTRLQADAVRRALSLGPDAPLRILVRAPLVRS